MSAMTWIFKNLLPSVYAQKIQEYTNTFISTLIRVKSLSYISHATSPSRRFDVVFWRLPGSPLHFYTVACSELSNIQAEPLFQLFEAALDQYGCQRSIKDALAKYTVLRFTEPDYSHALDEYKSFSPSSSGEFGTYIYVSPVFAVDDIGLIHPDVTSSSRVASPVINFYDYMQAIDDGKNDHAWVLVANIFRHMGRSITATIGQYEEEDYQPVVRFNCGTQSGTSTQLDFRIPLKSVISVVPRFKLATPLGLCEKAPWYIGLDCTVPEWKIHQDHLQLKTILNLCKINDQSDKNLALSLYYSFANADISKMDMWALPDSNIAVIRWLFAYGMPDTVPPQRTNIYLTERAPVAATTSKGVQVYDVVKSIAELAEYDFCRYYNELTPQSQDAFKKAVVSIQAFKESN